MSLTYKQMFALNVKLSKENEKLERNIPSLNDHIEYFEGNNARIGIDFDDIIT